VGLAGPVDVLAKEPCVSENKSVTKTGVTSFNYRTHLAGTMRCKSSDMYCICLCHQVSVTYESLWLTTDQKGDTQRFTHVAL
jgi:hypothetical protein